MNDKKYIFFDIDGTLLNSDAQVSNSTKTALKKAQEKGHEIFICTGRVRHIVPKVLLNLNFDGIIAGTGSYIEYKGNVIFEKYFSKEQIISTLSFLRKNDIANVMSAENECVMGTEDARFFIDLFSNGKLSFDDLSSISDAESPFLDSLEPLIIDDTFENYYTKYSNVTDFIYAKSPFTVSEMRKYLDKSIHVEKASFKNPDEYSGEITLNDCNKGKAILFFLDYIGANKKDSISIGDGFNDVDMLDATSLSIAMGNSPDKIKQMADHVTDSIDRDGIYNALKYFNIIE